MKKINVAILMGGKSSEHEISLISGKEVTKNLNTKKYNLLPIIISKDGSSWQIGEGKQELLDSPTRKQKSKNRKSKLSDLTTTEKTSLIKDEQIDVVFIALHGTNGEDGKVQGFLDLIQVPYTGSGLLASALGMDKIYSRKIFTQSGLNTPKYILVKKTQRNQPIENLKFPVFIKPSNQGSSVGTTKAKNDKELKNGLSLALKYDQTAIVEEYLDGVEVTGAILGNENPVALPLVEIVPKKDFFDYEAKYNANLTDEIVPARISKFLTKKAQSTALIAYKSLGCRGFGRVDMIIKGPKVYVLEVNTIPGLTPVSLFPKAAKAAGISYPKLLDKIIALALES